MDLGGRGIRGQHRAHPKRLTYTAPSHPCSSEMFRKHVRDEVARPPTHHRAPDSGGFPGQRFIQQLLFHDSKPIPAQALTQTVQMTVMTPTNALSTTTGTALLVCVPLLHSKKPYKRQNFGFSLCSQQLPQVLLDSTHPMLKIFKWSLAMNR